MSESPALPKLSRKQKWLAGFACVHVLLVFCGSISFRPSTPVDNWVDEKVVEVASEMEPNADGTPSAAQRAILLVPTPGQVVQTYQSYSGSDAGYGFFAPGVGAQLRVRFQMEAADGRTWVENVVPDSSGEAKLRYGGLVLQLGSGDMTDEQRDKILQSFAAWQFGKHPEAKFVTARVELLGISRENPAKGVSPVDFPTMQEFREGKKPRWIVLYPKTYERSQLAAR